MNRFIAFGIAGAAVLLLVLVLVIMSWTTIPAGHVGVTTWWGEVYGDSLRAGPHFVNPLAGVTQFDIREQTEKETISMPSKDELLSEVDISTQFKLDPTKAGLVLATVGTLDQLLSVHLHPNLRSRARELGRDVENAEDYFDSATQDTIQAGLDDTLIPLLGEKGLIVSRFLIRKVELPESIQAGIRKKKLRDQQIEEQRAEQERFTVEQQQVKIAAEAKRDAAVVEAEMIQALADARAYEIEKLTAATWEYVTLRLIDATRASVGEILEAMFPSYRRADEE